MVFTHGFSISDITICDTGFSDHKSILFTATFPGGPGVTSSPARWTRHFTVIAAEEFASAYAVTIFKFTIFKMLISTSVLLTIPV